MAAARLIGIIVTVIVLTALPVVAMAATESSATTAPESATSSQDVSGPAFATQEVEAPHEAAETEGKGGLPQLNIATYPSQIFWLLIMFSVLYLAFSKKVLPSIGSVVGARETLIRGNLDRADSLRQQAEAIREDYEASLAKARSDAAQAVQNVESAMKTRAAENMDVFRGRADNEMKAAEDSVAEAKIIAMKDISGIVVEASSLAAEKITGVSSDRRQVQGIVDALSGSMSADAKAA